MSALLLNNLEVRSFRGFQHLKIEHLGRVNLIVGKNNVGKSALLEALRLYASKRSLITILELLGVYDENSQENKQFAFAIPAERLAALKYLFYGRKDVRLHLEPIQIGPIDSEVEKLTINVGWHKLNERGERELWQLTPEEYDTADKLDPYLDMRIEGKPIIYSLDWISSAPPFRQDTKRVLCVFRGPDGLSKQEMGKLWDDIALTSLEQEVVAALRVIAPGVERLNLVADPNSAALGIRVPVVKVQDIEEPLLLSNLGDGMQRMLDIALALVNARGGMLLVDEIENGLHYSVLPSLWQIIFQLAHRLNIQVFATSHSRDCIEAFQRVAEEDKQTEGMLIRLESKKGEIAATLFDERELSIATREQIEVR